MEKKLYIAPVVRTHRLMSHSIMAATGGVESNEEVQNKVQSNPENTFAKQGFLDWDDYDDQD